METRTGAGTPATLRSGAATSGPTIEGHAAIFNQWTTLCPGLRERINPGAFAASLKAKRDVICCWQHDPSALLGRSASGSLHLEEDSKGLAFKVTPPDTTTGRDVVALMKRGDVAGCSFAFLPKKWRDEYGADGAVQSTLLEVDLRDVSLVVSPAYKQASATVKERGTAVKTIEPSHAAKAAGSTTTNKERAAAARVVLDDYKRRGYTAVVYTNTATEVRTEGVGKVASTTRSQYRRDIDRWLTKVEDDIAKDEIRQLKRDAARLMGGRR